MKRTLKAIISITLVLAILFSFASCSGKTKPSIDFENPLEGKTYEEIIGMANEIKEDRTYATVENNSFEIQSVKTKKIIVSGLNTVISAVSIVIAFAIGGIYTTPAYYMAAKDNKFIELKLKYTNNTDHSVMIGDAIHMLFAETDDQIINGSLLYVSSIGNIDSSCTEVVESGKSKTFSLIIEIPKSYEKNHNTFNFYFDVNGEVYSLMFVA